MKIRIGFVANSSSSTYICANCGASGGGLDVGPDDAGFVTCNRYDHSLCAACAERAGLDPEVIAYGYAEVPECPVCNLVVVSTADMVEFLMQRYNDNRDGILRELRVLAEASPKKDKPPRDRAWAAIRARKDTDNG